MSEQLVHSTDVADLDDQPPLGFYATDDYRGPDYLRVLQALHSNLEPKSYFEIGTSSGTSLALATCTSLAVDPLFRISVDVVGTKPACHLFQMGSDDFFAKFNPIQYLGGRIDIAFLDGMHWFEFLLRDFINTEKSCRKNSIVLVHDCLPTDTHIARRIIDDHTLARYSLYPKRWAGDVWKVIAILLKYRPDLVIYGCRTRPTGLVAITNLDPESTVLEDNFFEMVQEFEAYPFDVSANDEHLGGLKFIEPDELLSPSVLSLRFWL